MSDLLALPLTLSAVTASSAATPAANLLDPKPGRVWQSTATNATLTLDLGQDQDIDLLWLGYTNLSRAATWEIRCATAAQGQAYLANVASIEQASIQAWASDDALGPAYHALWWRASGPISRRYVQVSLSDPTNADGVLRAGRVYLARAYRPSWPREAGSERGILDLSTKERLRTGPLVINPGARIKTRAVTFTGLAAEEMRTFFWPLLLSRGETGDLLHVIDPTPALGRHELIIYGVLARARSIEIVAANYQSIRLEIEEMA